MNELFGKKQLLQALKDAGLPATYQSLLKYERSGIVRQPIRQIKYTDRSWRAYTIDELRDIIEAIRIHKKKVNK